VAVLSRTPRVLVVNPGSSSLKLRMLEPDDALGAEDDLPASSGEVERSALEAFLERTPAPDAVGVRVVHGGPTFRASVQVDTGVLEQLDATAELAPLHNPPALLALRVLRQTRPSVPLVACFDTAFHASLPAAAAVYAVPWRWTAEWGVRRYGFHGLSHAWASRRTAELLGRPLESLRIVTCHLGAGASLCAIAGGVSVDTTMGFTPMEGLVMATRSGSLDPGLLLWVQRRHGLSVEEAERALDRESGLLGISGHSADMREVLRAADAGESRSRLALDVYLHRLRGCIASMASALRGLDALVFTGGVGEHSSQVRAQACAGLEFLGVRLDENLNSSTSPDAVVSPAGSQVATLVVAAREDLEIARQVRGVLAAAPEPGH
jgi:acetate kinase